MKLLLVAATEGEITPALQYLQPNRVSTSSKDYTIGPHTLQLCITGVGMMATTYELTKKTIQNKDYDFALQVGVGGSFDQKMQLGQVVWIAEDQYGDLGAQDHNAFLDIFELGLLEQNAPPFSGKKLATTIRAIHQKIQLPRVSGLTVNTVSGDDFTIKSRFAKYNCQVESMEGAAFHYVCMKGEIPFAQVRSISNYVEPRDKSKWQMKEAIISLNKWLIDFLEHL